MDNLIFSFEMMGIGLLVVFASLLVLALILVGFNKIFYKGDSQKQEKDAAGQIESPRLKHNPKRAGAPAATSRAENIYQTEKIAAAMVALLYALETKKDTVVMGSDMPAAAANLWIQTGRARALSIRQDFMLLKRRKHREGGNTDEKI